MILLPCLDHLAAMAPLTGAIAFLEEQGGPVDIMINKALEADTGGAFALQDLPEASRPLPILDVGSSAQLGRA